MSRNLTITVIGVVALLIIGWWVMNRSQKASMQPTPQPMVSESASPQASESAMMGEAREIKVSGTDFAFSPASLSLKKGEKVKIVFENNGKFPHNLTVDKLGIATKTINSGQSDTVEFTADQTGSFVMYCSVGNHRQQGMEGTVEVE